jgi:dihydroorotase
MIRPLHLAAAVALGAVLGSPAAGQDYDLVLRGGRVLDPETGLDAVRDLGIVAGRIQAISETPLEGRRVVDVSGNVVAPGFIDLHAHGQDTLASGFQVRDGVTTALELEGGAAPVGPFYLRREGDARIHFGASASHGAVRRRVMGSSQAAVYDAASPEQVEEVVAGLEAQLRDGALGIGIGLQYVPGATREEIYRVMELAAREGVTVFCHVRFAGVKEPEAASQAIQEMIAGAAATGASVHVVHIGSSGLTSVPFLLEMISTAIQSAIFDDGWRERLDATYEDIEWVETGERLSEENWDEYRDRGGLIIAHIIPEDAITAALSEPDVLVASDGTPFVNGRAHPRGVGTFARVLGRYVRDRGTLDLLDAVSRMTLLPARRLESAVPQMRRKGRIQVGMDADITVFDPEQVLDRATFADPATPSQGIEYVVVGGELVVDGGVLVAAARPGQPVRRRPILP